MIEVAISDNGTGIIDAQRISILLYDQAGGKGTGLGLSICYGIVRAHGGEIQCGTMKRERGVLLWCGFQWRPKPRLRRPPRKKRGDERATDVVDGGPILLIEDEPSVIAFLRAAWSAKDMRW